MNQLGAVCVLDDYGTLRLGGADVEKFLQGQLSNDVRGSRRVRCCAPDCTTPGTHAGTAVADRGADQGDILALLPLELLPTVAALLRRYVLRAKVTISDDSPSYRVLGLAPPDAPARSVRAARRLWCARRPRAL